MISIIEYIKKKEELVNKIKISSNISLQKKSSNLFRDRDTKDNKIDVRSFNNVISIDEKNLICEVEGMTTYEDLLNETIKFNLMPCVVPELKTITIGGAATGIGVESSSFKYGFVHETILEMEILLSYGKTIICNNSENKDLFYAFPNSYGTLGYALKLKIKLIPVKKYVKIENIKFTNQKEYFKELNKLCLSKEIDFIDGTLFNENEMYISIGNFTDKECYVSNYKYMNIYYKSIQSKKIDHLTILDYIWRWDTDWFWCSKHFYMQNKFIRFLFGKFLLRSSTYWKIKSFVKKYKIFKNNSESVVQDVEIPIENCEKFLDFFNRNIGIKPIWVCPVKKYDKNVKYNLYLTDPNKLYINFGFWDVIKSNKKYNYFNKKIESKVEEIKGKKSLYSTSFYTKENFWKLYNGKYYRKLKNKYDKNNKFKDLYEKCVERK